MTKLLHCLDITWFPVFSQLCCRFDKIITFRNCTQVLCFLPFKLLCCFWCCMTLLHSNSRFVVSAWHQPLGLKQLLFYFSCCHSWIVVLFLQHDLFPLMHLNPNNNCTQDLLYPPCSHSMIFFHPCTWAQTTVFLFWPGVSFLDSRSVIQTQCDFPPWKQLCCGLILDDLPVLKLLCNVLACLDLSAYVWLCCGLRCYDLAELEQLCYSFDTAWTNCTQTPAFWHDNTCLHLYTCVVVAWHDQFACTTLCLCLNMTWKMWLHWNICFDMTWFFCSWTAVLIS